MNVSHQNVVVLIVHGQFVLGLKQVRIFSFFGNIFSECYMKQNFFLPNKFVAEIDFLKSLVFSGLGSFLGESRGETGFSIEMRSFKLLPIFRIEGVLRAFDFLPL